MKIPAWFKVKRESAVTNFAHGRIYLPPGNDYHRVPGTSRYIITRLYPITRKFSKLLPGTILTSLKKFHHHNLNPCCVSTPWSWDTPHAAIDQQRAGGTGAPGSTRKLSLSLSHPHTHRRSLARARARSLAKLTLRRPCLRARLLQPLPHRPELPAR